MSLDGSQQEKLGGHTAANVRAQQPASVAIGPENSSTQTAALTSRASEKDLSAGRCGAKTPQKLLETGEFCWTSFRIYRKGRTFQIFRRQRVKGRLNKICKVVLLLELCDLRAQCKRSTLGQARFQPQPRTVKRQCPSVSIAQVSSNRFSWQSEANYSDRTNRKALIRDRAQERTFFRRPEVPGFWPSNGLVSFTCTLMLLIMLMFASTRLRICVFGRLRSI